MIIPSFEDTLNFDGAVISNRATGGFIVRNHKKSMLVIGGKLLPSSSVLFAELIGLWLGIKYLIIHYYTYQI